MVYSYATSIRVKWEELCCDWIEDTGHGVGHETFSCLPVWTRCPGGDWCCWLHPVLVGSMPGMEVARKVLSKWGFKEPMFSLGMVATWKSRWCDSGGVSHYWVSGESIHSCVFLPCSEEDVHLQHPTSIYVPAATTWNNVREARTIVAHVLNFAIFNDVL